MLFMVPEAEKNENTENAAGDKQFNVELDLDDAPFLAEDKEPEVQEPKADKTEAPVEVTPEAKPAQGRKNILAPLLAHKKKILLAGGGLFLLIILGVVAKVFFFSSSPEDVEPKVAEEKVVEGKAAEPTRIVVPSVPETAPAPDAPKYNIAFEPFHVPMKGSEGEIRFLVLEFSVPTDEPILMSEMNVKMLVLRDAVFYFLRNSTFPLQMDNAFAEELREDLVSVLNEHLVSGKAQKVLFSRFYVED